MDILKKKNFFFKYKNSLITHLGRSLWQKNSIVAEVTFKMVDKKIETIILGLKDLQHQTSKYCQQFWFCSLKLPL